MAGLTDLFPNTGSIATIGAVVIWGIVAIFIGLILGGALYLFIIKANQKAIVEVNMVNRRLKNFNARDRRNRSHKKQLYVGGKINKFIPNVQQSDVYLRGMKETIFLVKDNNGMHHTARLPSMDELVKWYKAQGIDYSEEVKKIKKAETEEEKLGFLDKLKKKARTAKEKKIIETLGTIYLQPNPLENLEWLADEQNQASQHFATGLLKHPMWVWIGTLTLCAVTFIITLVVTKMM